MRNLAVDFRLDGAGRYRVFVYSEIDEIRPWSAILGRGGECEIDGRPITFYMLEQFRSGRLLQNADGSFSVREHVSRST